VRKGGKQGNNGEQDLEQCARGPVSTPRLQLLSLAKIRKRLRILWEFILDPSSKSHVNLAS
jgi:hypothetical protein